MLHYKLIYNYVYMLHIDAYLKRCNPETIECPRPHLANGMKQTKFVIMFNNRISKLG